MDPNSFQGPCFTNVDVSYEPLRKPHKKFKLSPNAPEFVPQNKQTNNSTSLIDDLQKLNINSNPSSAVAVSNIIQQNSIKQNHSQYLIHNQINSDFPHHQLQNLNNHQNSTVSSHNDQYHYYNPQSHSQGNNYKIPPVPAITIAKFQSIQNRLYNSNHQLQNNVLHQNKSINSQYAEEQKQKFQYLNHHLSLPQSLISIANNSNSSSNSDSASQDSFAEISEEEAFIVTYITEIVECLNSDPGSFDSITPRFLEVLRSYGRNQNVLCNIMEIIFTQSIDEQNFRYMGAKLYSLLDSINPKKDSLFRNLLTIKLNYNREEVVLFMQNENIKVRGTTLFLAELYMQLRNNGSRIPEIAQNIIFTMKQLLEKTTPENVKCICLALKLAGYDLEMDCPNDLKYIVDKLGSLKMDVSTSRLLETILNLYKNNWGRKEIINQQANYTSNVPLVYSNEPVFYGPDGEILTEEENSFLEANLLNDNDDEYDFDDYEFEGMDPEMEKDYTEFLKNTINHSC